MSNPIECITGSENFPGMQAKFHVFVPPQTAFPSHSGEAPLFAVAKQGKHGIGSLRNPNRIPAHAHGNDGAGFFMQGAFNLPEGLIVKVFMMRKTPSGTRVASAFLRSRSEAALVRYEFELTGYRDATQSRAYIEGRFDPITLEQAQALGVRVPPMNARQFDLPTVRMLLNRRELSAAISAPPVTVEKVVTNSDGEAVTIRENKRKRFLDI